MEWTILMAVLIVFALHIMRGLNKDYKNKHKQSWEKSKKVLDSLKDL